MNIVIINRGVPGSGKSTLTSNLVERSIFYNYSIKVHSTDDLCMVDGKYQFDFKLAGERHKQNFINFCESINNNTNIVISDNTNTKTRDYSHYVTYAEEYDYTVIEVLFTPDSVENHMKRNTHNVPEATIQAMINNLNNNNISIADIQYIVDFNDFKASIDNVVENILSLVNKV